MTPQIDIIDIFDDMLELTADLLFDTEKLLYFRDSAPGSVLDVGCGNGAYLNRLKSAFPESACTGIDLNDAILHRAHAQPNQPIACYHGSYEELPASGTFDTIIARLVIDHIPDRAHFFRWLQERTDDGARIIIIDIEDAGILHADGLPLFASMYEAVRRRIRRPSLLALKDILKMELAHFQFHPITITSYDISTDNMQMRRKVLRYLQLVSQLFTGTVLSQERARELDEWYHSDQNLNIRMFGLEAIRASSQPLSKGE
ncbi:class I SAM-dependent methyltransferase [Paenibacillus apiarius]|uniref:Class I SAM-dependent methyltransferase n=1 Tax=Paenibacillus apiarius TaxID=46240 RepID=A0ABT4DNQ5_9BACL|nr:class I SAM-dependent methyltransferase [Paenibacillus apiarius]MCY9512985.1 class I SAM-dependent methyltransferase [Paenibacillus apiarius]MCY9518969.1 class I SAM-dependent methyltransferase [Paenibacillus apiarius]MCY9550778.1 class I SAM-dependent methyltransferase [Paenibacillus apiarius]MCY9559788.1 class I SAM-dependent methyltransferase [Paenibacillus apiarius]MCY9682031.1 class I SAM-dependent methyltransferase [Paenibacillus apiarius]